MADAGKEMVITATTQEVLNTWLQVLGDSNIGIHDTFLDLGGDSLNAMSCIARLRSKFGVNLSVIDFLLEDATPASIGTIIDRKLLAIGKQMEPNP